MYNDRTRKKKNFFETKIVIVTALTFKNKFTTNLYLFRSDGLIVVETSDNEVNWFNFDKFSLDNTLWHCRLNIVCEYCIISFIVPLNQNSHKRWITITYITKAS